MSPRGTPSMMRTYRLQQWFKVTCQPSYLASHYADKPWSGTFLAELDRAKRLGRATTGENGEKRRGEKEGPLQRLEGAELPCCCWCGHVDCIMEFSPSLGNSSLHFVASKLLGGVVTVVSDKILLLL